MTKYKVGDKVRIIRHREFGMNSEGKMDEYLDTVMTITSCNPNNFYPYKMEEDYGRWGWCDNMISGLAVQENDLTAQSFTLDSLESGDIAVTRDGRKYLVILSKKLGLIFQREGGYNTRKVYTSDLKNIFDDPDSDIVKVYRPNMAHSLINSDKLNDKYYFTLVWEEESPRKYYLQDNFINDTYLNFCKTRKVFFYSGKEAFGDFQTQFTDQEIKDLDIPIERFTKIPVED